MSIHKTRHGAGRSDVAYWDEAVVFRHAHSPVAVWRVDQIATAMHGHAFTEVVIVEDGMGVHVVDGRRCELVPGDFFVVSSQRRHAYEEPRNLHLINIMIRGDFMERWLDSLLGLLGGGRLFGPGFYQPPALSPEGLAECLRLVERLENEADIMGDGFSLMQEGLLLELLASLSRRCDNAPGADECARPRIGAVLGYMERHYRDALTIAELAGMAGMSERSFMRHFKDVTSLPPMQYLQRVRILQACRQLRNSQRSIQEIAAACGFDDGHYFHRIFRRHVGQTPGRYRKTGNG